MNCNDVEGSDPSPLVKLRTHSHSPLVRLKTQSHSPLVKLKTQTLSTGEVAPTGSVPHSEPIVSTVRHVTGNDQDYLRKIPRVVVQKSALL